MEDESAAEGECCQRVVRTMEAEDLEGCRKVLGGTGSAGRRRWLVSL